MIESIWNSDFLSIFEELDNFFIDTAKEKEIKSYILPINSKDFDYERLKEVLLEPLAWFCLSRKTKNEYDKEPMKLSKKVREKLRHYISNKGELWELLLYCFLETDLKAPKILSKLELKTARNDYVKWADGIHYKKKWEDYFLFFWEAKMYHKLNWGINDALLSINDFKLWIRRDKNKKEIERDPQKYWISFDRWLISDNLDKETFSKEEKDFLKQIIIPSKASPNVQHGFAVFIGYEVNTDWLKGLKHSDFKEELDKKIKSEINDKKEKIVKDIKKYSLEWHNFNFYFLPFTNLDKNRLEITKHIQD